MCGSRHPIARQIKTYARGLSGKCDHRLRLWRVIWERCIVQVLYNSRGDIGGIACEIEGAEKKNRLTIYEGNNYNVTECLLNLVTQDRESDQIFCQGLLLRWKQGWIETTFNLDAYERARSTRRVVKVWVSTSDMIRSLRLFIRIEACPDSRSTLCKNKKKSAWYFRRTKCMTWPRPWYLPVSWRECHWILPVRKNQKIIGLFMKSCNAW